MVVGAAARERRYDVKESVRTLTDERARKTASSTLSKCLSEGLLFPEEEINTTLEAIAERLGSGKALYQRWKQQTGSKVRELSVPNAPLKTFLVTYVLPWIKSFPVHSCAHGGEVGWSVEKSLRTHLPLKRVLSFDMKDAFGQIDANLVSDFFYERLNTYVQREEERTAANLLAFLCTVRSETEKRVLPQGSPVSVALFNRMLCPTDTDLHERASRKNVKYSRWIDDFILSSAEVCEADYFSDLLRIAELRVQVAQSKVFFQHNACYLLGHRIDRGVITKVAREEGERIRGKYSSCFVAC